MITVLAACLALTLVVEGPAALAGAADRIRGVDRDALEADLARAGLDVPSSVRVTLVAEEDDLARLTPSWVVGRALAPSDVLVFPARVASYPHDSLEAVTRHEIVHLALSARAGGRPLPRWFHEGVATSVEAGWGAGDQLRLVFAAAADPTIEDVGQLFRSPTRPDTTLAYLLAAVLVDDLRRRHGSAVPGRIAARVGEGQTFADAFAAETGEAPGAAASRAWAGYRRWTAWTPVLTSVTSIWTFIVALAVVAYAVTLRRRARRRRAWADEERDGPADAR